MTMEIEAPENADQEDGQVDPWLPERPDGGECGNSGQRLHRNTADRCESRHRR